MSGQPSRLSRDLRNVWLYRKFFATNLRKSDQFHIAKSIFAGQRAIVKVPPLTRMELLRTGRASFGYVDGRFLLRFLLDRQGCFLMKPCHHRAINTFAPLSLFFATLFCANISLFAQQNEAPGRVQLGGEPRATRPAAGGDVAIRKELLVILQNWEKAGTITKTLEGQHRRYVYDSVYKVIRQAEGEFYYETPDRGRIDLTTPKEFKEGQVANLKGVQYTIQKDREERWVCDGTQLISINEARKEYERIPIPPEHRGKNIENGPLPFVFGITVEKMVARYNITLFEPSEGGQHDLSKNKIHLKVTPLWEVDAASWQEAEILLWADTYLPEGIRLKHPGGNAETVYVFGGVKRNASRGVFSVWKGNPFEPRLNGYKELTATAMEAPSRERR